jgi:hypothetical protein
MLTDHHKSLLRIRHIASKVEKLDSSLAIFLGVALRKHTFILPSIPDTGNITELTHINILAMAKSLTEPELNQYNTNALCDDLRRKQAESGRQIISSPLKQPRQLQSDPRRA